MWRVVGVVRQIRVDPNNPNHPHDPDDAGRFTWLRERWTYQNAGTGQDFRGGKTGADAPAVRMLDIDGDGEFETFQHFLCDRQGSVVAVVAPGADANEDDRADGPGAVMARVNYSAYGVPRICRKSDLNRDGVVDLSGTGGDWADWDQIKLLAGASSTAARWLTLADFDGDGVFNAGLDEAAFGAQLLADYAADYAWPLAEELGNLPLYGGCWWDATLRIYHVRHRAYDPEHGRWLQRDPIGYAGGWNLYEYGGGQPGGLRIRWGWCMTEAASVRQRLRLESRSRGSGLESGDMRGLLRLLLARLWGSVLFAAAVDWEPHHDHFEASDGHDRGVRRGEFFVWRVLAGRGVGFGDAGGVGMGAVGGCTDW